MKYNRVFSRQYPSYVGIQREEGMRASFILHKISSNQNFLNLKPETSSSRPVPCAAYTKRGVGRGLAATKPAWMTNGSSTVGGLRGVDNGGAYRTGSARDSSNSGYG